MRDGRIAALGVPGDVTADQVVQAAGLHVLPCAELAELRCPMTLTTT